MDYAKRVLNVLTEVGVKRIVTHIRPHFSDLLAIFLLRETPEGRRMFSGIENAQVLFVDKSWQWGALDAANHRNIMVGIGGGPFDEHANAFEDAKPHCEAVLVARVLGLDTDPVLGPWLGYATRNDAGEYLPREIATAFMAWMDAPIQGDPDWVSQELVRRAMVCYDILSTMLARCFEPTTVGKPLFDKLVSDGASREVVRSGFRTPLRVFTAEVDDVDAEPLTRYARSPKGGDQHVVICRKRQSGHVAVFVSTWVLQFVKGFTLHHVVRALRVAELQRAGKYVGRSQWRQLSDFGDVGGVWYLHDSGSMILNGSRVAEKTPPTQLPLALVSDLVRLILMHDIPVQASFQPSCKVRGECDANCRLFSYGLPVCNQMRP